MKGRKPHLTVVDGGQKGRAPAPSATLAPCGKDEWDRVAPILQAQGRLKPEIMATVEGYCRAVGLATTFSGILERDGYFLDTERGKVAHPAYKMMQDAAREARLLAAELQLTRMGKVDPAAGKGAWRDDADLLA